MMDIMNMYIYEYVYLIDIHIHYEYTLITCVAIYRVTGWRKCIRCLTMQVAFCKRATIYRALLRKMTHEDKAFYVSVPPSVVYA